MKKYIFAVLLLLSVVKTEAQQIPLSSQYMMNDIVINPAIAGSDRYSVVTRLTNRNQWVGIEGAPVTQTVSVHALIERFNVGLGAYVFNDQIGPTSQMGIQTMYSYHMRVNDYSKLSFGLQLGLFQYKVDGSKLTTDMPNDVAITKAGTDASLVPDATFGMYYYTHKFYAGAAVAHLVPFKLLKGEQLERQRVGSLTRHYYIHSGVKIDMNEEWIVEPSVLIRLLYPTPISIDINAKMYYQNTFWLGGSYRMGDSFVIMAGLKLKDKFHIGYSYDITTSGLADYTKGSHEFMLGYDIDLGRGSRKLPTF